MKNFLFFSFLVLSMSLSLFAASSNMGHQEAQTAFQYLLKEVDRDATIGNEEQQAMVENFERLADQISPEATPLLINLLLEETQARIFYILQNAALNEFEVNERLASNQKAIQGVELMTVEIARQMLFFVAEFEIHRHYVYEYGMALGCPAEQLLRHDLSKLSAEQFEGYARFFRGGRKEIDRPRQLAAWALHQYEEHHHESYQKEGFSFDEFPEERLRNNMRESVADILAAARQRGGYSTIQWLTNVFPKHKPHYRLIPFFQEALIKAHALYLKAEEDPSSENTFYPCWNEEIEEIFKKCALSPDEEMHELGFDCPFHF